MISTKNPFPGMNPFFERRWADIHTVLIGEIRNTLNPVLPLDLSARAEEGVSISESDSRPRYRADVAISTKDANADSWKRGIPPTWQPEKPTAAVVVEPVVLRVGEPTPRWVEIRTSGGDLITVIELLSPTNKAAGAIAYLRKQTELLGAAVNLVEIDFLRGGIDVLPFDRRFLGGIRPDAAGCPYFICVSPAVEPGIREVYPCQLRERIPAIRIPLRPADDPVVLDLQPLLDRAYENGRCWQENFESPLDPPLNPDDDAWARERLGEAGFEFSGA